MGIGHWWAGGMLAVVLGTSCGSGLPVQASSPAPQLAQVTPNTVTGQLDENIATLEDGSYLNLHTFEGRAGEAVSIELVSNLSGIILILLEPDKQVIAYDGIANSQLTVTLPTTDTYYIGVIARSSEGDVDGQYTLNWNPATVAEVTQTEALQQATELNQQSIELYQAGRYQDSVPIAREALSILREQLGERHPDVATSLNNLAQLYTALGRYGEAETLYQESLDIRREQLGERHPDVALSLNNLALLYQAQGRYGEAEPLHFESLDIYREQLGDRHPAVAKASHELGFRIG